MTRRKEEEHHVNHHFGCTFNFGVYFMFFLFPFEKISNTQLAPDDKRSIVIEITGPIRYYLAHEKLNNAQTANTHTKSFSIVNHFQSHNNRICCLLWANECACIWYALTNNGLPCLVLSCLLSMWVWNQCLVRPSSVQRSAFMPIIFISATIVYALLSNK